MQNGDNRKKQTVNSKKTISMNKFAIYIISICWIVNYSLPSYAQSECQDSIFWPNYETAVKTGDYIQIGDTLLGQRFTYIGDSLAAVLINDNESEIRSISIRNYNSIRSPVLDIQYDINDKLKNIHILLDPQTMEITTYDFHPNGMISSILTFKGKNRNGKYISFYDNGIIENFGNFHTGAEEGLWLEYHKNGVNKNEGCYKLGYDEEEGYYFSDKDGYWNEYDENEKLIKKILYKNGVIIQEESW